MFGLRAEKKVTTVEEKNLSGRYQDPAKETR